MSSTPPPSSESESTPSQPTPQEETQDQPQEQEPEQENCPICQDPFDNPSTVIPCNHQFNHECIQTWLRTLYDRQGGQSPFRCPNCRRAIQGVRTANPDRLLGIRDVIGEGYRSSGNMGGGDGRPMTFGSHFPGIYGYPINSRGLVIGLDGNLVEWQDIREREYVMGMDRNLVEWRDRRGEQREIDDRNRRDHNQSGNRTQANETRATLVRLLDMTNEHMRIRQLNLDNKARLYFEALHEEERATALARRVGMEDDESARNHIVALHGHVLGSERDLIAADRSLLEAQQLLIQARARIHTFNVDETNPRNRRPIVEYIGSFGEDPERTHDSDGRRGPESAQGLLEAPRRSGFLEGGPGNGTWDYSNSHDNMGHPIRIPTNSGYHPSSPSVAPPPRRATPERDRSRGPPGNIYTNLSFGRQRSQSRPPQPSPTQRDNSRVRPLSPPRPPLISPIQSQSFREQDIRQQTRDHWSHVSFNQERGDQGSVRPTWTSQAGPSRAYSNDNGEGPSSRQTGGRDDSCSGVPEEWLVEDQI